MKRTYETFEELAREITKGEGSLHAFNCALNTDKYIYGDTCMAWQKGVLDFAEWLDYIGVEVKITDDMQDFYNFMAKKYKNSNGEKGS